MVLASSIKQPVETPITELKFVLLGGTVGNNSWRNDFVYVMLCSRGLSLQNQVYNPVVPIWTDSASANEELAKQRSTYQLYYLSNPQDNSSDVSAFSIADANRIGRRVADELAKQRLIVRVYPDYRDCYRYIIVSRL